jgi:tetratricopeptide (TPR) repeat protein
MRVMLEDFVPYDRSVQWRLHDAYFAACGSEAWTEGAIPQFASSNFAIARQHARLFVALCEELVGTGALPARGHVSLLEIGGGSGIFAANFLHALDTACGPAGAKLARRVRYVFTDYSATTVRDATTDGPLKSFVEAGRVVPGLFDLRKPGAVRRLDGHALDTTFAAVLANYVCCVAPLKIVKKEQGVYSEQHTRTELEVADDAPAATPAQRLQQLLDNPTRSALMSDIVATPKWVPTPLASLFPNPLHVESIRAGLEGFDAATLRYPWSFIDCMAALTQELVKGGMILVSDYGSIDRESIAGDDDREPQHYGNALNHGVEFALFDAVAPRLGMSVIRTANPMRAVHTAAFRATKRLPKSFRETFTETHIEHSDGDDLLVFSEAAFRLSKAGEHAIATRLYERCIRLDPASPELRFRLADSAIEAHYDKIALEHAAKGIELDEAQRYDFQFLIGRGLYRQRKFGEAIGAWTFALMREKHPITYTNMGLAYEAIGDIDMYREAIALRPDTKRANERLAGIAKELKKKAKQAAKPAPAKRAAKLR